MSLIASAVLILGGVVTPPKPAAQYCAALLPAVQALVKSRLTVKSADDPSTDVMHTGEPGYFACVFASAPYQLTVITSDAPEKRFTDASAKGYAPLAGVGDRARVHNGSMEWIDVLKGPHFCEVINVLPADGFAVPDWTQAAGKICLAAIAAL